MLASLAKRARIPELMDDPTLPPDEHREALRGLARLNALSRAHARRWKPIATLARESNRPIRVLDVATGDGGFPIAAATWAGRAGLKVEAAGCDISDTALTVAKESAAKAGVGVEFFRHDVLKEALPAGFDVVTCSLFLHHFSEQEVVRILTAMRDAAARMVLVNDLARGRTNLVLVWLGCRLLTRSRVVRFDGPASIRSAFTRAEMLALAERAGLHGVTVAAAFPCEFLLTWRRA